jgi:hypothetical protein
LNIPGRSAGGAEGTSAGKIASAPRVADGKVTGAGSCAAGAPRVADGTIAGAPRVADGKIAACGADEVAAGGGAPDVAVGSVTTGTDSAEETITYGGRRQHGAEDAGEQRKTTGIDRGYDLRSDTMKRNRKNEFEAYPDVPHRVGIFTYI